MKVPAVFALSCLLCLLCLPALASPGGCAAPDALFPFVLPWDDAASSVANVSGLNGGPAGTRGFVTVKDGHLWNGGRRLRLWGTNLTFGACFPEHRAAEKLAARMAKFGINAVRFHHMDMFAAPRGIFREDMRRLDPGQMDRLDYLVAQLKKHGIYSDLNLHVSRTYPGMPPWGGMPSFCKGVDLFYPPMIEMQREYARDLLQHVNPYTKNRYVDEPAVAIVEINNEDGFILEWFNGSLDAMPDPYRADLARQWNAFLTTRYSGDTTALRRAWDARDEPMGEEMLVNSSLAGDLSGWNLEQHEGAKAEAAVAQDGPGGAAAVKISVRQRGSEGWHVQFNQPGLDVREGRVYTLAFQAKAADNRHMSVNIGQAHDPWSVLWSSDLDLGPEWKTFQFTIRMPGGDGNARVSFSGLGKQPGDVWLSGLSLRPGGSTGPRADLPFGAIAVFAKADFYGTTPGAQRDWLAFLWDTEERYWTGMARYLKDDLRVKGIVVGTAAGFSPAPIQAKLDAVDSHAYWQHPSFPVRPWDAEEWTVRNVSMAGAPDGGEIPGLALRRVTGKPFLVTEYNHPAPNTYSSEAFLLLAAYAALQDWDAVFQFDYGDTHTGNAPGRISGFFALDQHPTKLATFPAAAALFRRADVTSPRPWATVRVSRTAALEQMRRSGPWFGADAFGLSRLDALRRPVTMVLTETPAPAPSRAPETAPPIKSANDQLSWDSRPDRRFFSVNAPRSKAVVGFASGRAFDLGGVRIVPGKNRQDWAAISLTVMEGKDFRSPGRLLITATGDVENTDMRWKDASKNSVGSQWGKAPSLVEGIPAVITLPVPAKRVRAWALDERGRRGKPVSVQEKGGRAVLPIGPRYRTLWYEVVIR